MESIYDPKCFKASEQMALKDYFQSYGEVCHFPELVAWNRKLNPNNEEEYYDKIREEMNIFISNSQVRELAENCNISLLTLDEEPEDVPMEVPANILTRTKLESFYRINPNARHLNSVICLEVLEKKYQIATAFKFTSNRFIKMTTVVTNNSVLCDIVPGSNFIYSIIVYKPYAVNYYSKRNCSSKLRFAFEIDMLGTNTLAEFADNICCVSNTGLFREVENTRVNLAPLMNAKAHCPSQCIFIDGVLYNDFRSPDAIDYSSNIIQWAREKNIGTFTSELMEKTVLNTLKLRLGYPYVYIHQGNCEHIFTFSDARLIQPGDCLNSKKYPRITSINRVYNTLCFICGVTNAQWVVLECEKFPHEKVFLCTECCNSYLYIDRKKVTEFKLYPYYDEEMLTRHLNAVVVD